MPYQVDDLYATDGEPDVRQMWSQMIETLSDSVKAGAGPDVETGITAPDTQPLDEEALFDKYGQQGTVDMQLADGAMEAQPATSGKGSAWGGFRNGRIPAEALTQVGAGHLLETKAAKAWQRMTVDAAKAGVTLALTDSYRDYDAQVSVRARKGGKVATATPGTSVHGWGKAVDVNLQADKRAFDWMRANAGRYGYEWPKWAQRKGKSFERWHWEFKG